MKLKFAFPQIIWEHYFNESEHDMNEMKNFQQFDGNVKQELK